MTQSVETKRGLLRGFAAQMEPQNYGGFSDAGGEIERIVPALVAILEQKFGRELENLDRPILWEDGYEWLKFLALIIPGIEMPEDDGAVCPRCAASWEIDKRGNLLRAEVESEFALNHPVFATLAHECPCDESGDDAEGLAMAGGQEPDPQKGEGNA